MSAFTQMFNKAFNSNPFVPESAEDLTPTQVASIHHLEVIESGEYNTRQVAIYFTNGTHSYAKVERDAPWQPGDTPDKNNVCFLTLSRMADSNKKVYMAPGKAADYTDKINKAQEAEKLRRANMFNQ